MDRFTQFAVTAAVEAMAQSGLDLEHEDTARMGVFVSSGIGGISTIQNSCESGQSRGFDKVSPFFIPMAISNLAAGHIAIRFGLHGMCTAPVAACAGGSNAVGDAFRHIRDGYAEVMVAGGAEASITPLAMGGFTSMSALTTASSSFPRASIPFDAERSGFVMGEGAAILVLGGAVVLPAPAALRSWARSPATAPPATPTTSPPPTPRAPGAPPAWSRPWPTPASPPGGGLYQRPRDLHPPNDSGETAAIRKVFGGHADRLTTPPSP